MEELLEGIGLERYVPRFAENDVRTIDDLPSKPSKLENLLDITGITGNPGHVKKFKAALKDAQRSGGGGRPHQATTRRRSTTPAYNPEARTIPRPPSARRWPRPRREAAAS